MRRGRALDPAPAPAPPLPPPAGPPASRPGRDASDSPAPDPGPWRFRSCRPRTRSRPRPPGFCQGPRSKSEPGPRNRLASTASSARSYASRNRFDIFQPQSDMDRPMGHVVLAQGRLELRAQLLEQSDGFIVAACGEEHVDVGKPGLADGDRPSEHGSTWSNHSSSVRMALSISPRNR